MADELDGIATFVAVAETKGFRTAGQRLRVSHSAVSQTLRRLEERLGVPLVRRTTRSVHLTEAGERLYSSVRRRWTREPVSPRGGGNATDRAIRAQPPWRPRRST